MNKNQVHSQWFQSEWGFKINGQILTATIKRTYGHYGDIGNYDDRITHGIRINTKEPTKITLFTQVDLGGSTYFTEYKLPKAYKTKQEASLLFTAIGLSNESD